MADYQIRSLHDIELDMEGKGIEFSRLLGAVTILIGKGNLYPVQDHAVIKAAPQARFESQAVRPGALFR